MLSRVADSIYWMARYMERAENLARLLRANLSLMLDAGRHQSDSDAFWSPILMTTGDEEGYHALYSSLTGDDIADYLTDRPENPNSIVNCVRSARENARMVRDQITDEVWRSVNDLYLLLMSPKGKQMRDQTPTDFYEYIMQSSGMFQGVARATMMRDESWHFLQIGTYLERAEKTSRLVDTCSGVPLVLPPNPEAQPLRWQSLLHSCSGYHGYREHDNQLNPRSVLEFLFLSERFSRSVLFCVSEVDNALHKLVKPPGNATSPNPLRASGRLVADLKFATIDDILECGLHEYIDELQSKLNVVGKAIYETYVLYADANPVSPTANQPSAPLGAWHADLDLEMQQQQQQQQ
jgi:uncharacterized alpha-E superfamily protein